MIEVRECEFDLTRSIEFVTAWVKKRIGFIYAEYNVFQLELRLKTYVINNDLKTENELIAKLSGFTQEEEQKFIELLVNNETYFFREEKFYTDLKEKIIPELLANKVDKHIRFCGLACSSGQELYTIAFVCEELLQSGHYFTYELLGTDISLKVLNKFKEGAYSKLEFERGLNIEKHGKYFDVKDDLYQIKSEIVSKVKTKRINLKEGLYLDQEYDVILCRNVLYYLEEDVKKDVVASVHRKLSKGGVFVLSGTENLFKYSELFERKDDCFGSYIRAEEKE